jgi:hypothetical protein
MGSVTFYAYGPFDKTETGKSIFGHVFIKVIGVLQSGAIDETVGFYRDHDGWLPFGKGEIRDDRKNIEHAKDLCTFDIEQNELEAADGVIRDWEKTPPTYGVHDCVGFAEAIAKACHLDHMGWQTQFPMTFIQDLYDLNTQRVKERRQLAAQV